MLQPQVQPFALVSFSSIPKSMPKGRAPPPRAQVLEAEFGEANRFNAQVDEQVRKGIALPKAVTPAVLSRHPIVLHESGSQTRRIVDDWFLSGGFTVKPAMELGSVEAIKELVDAGLGCGIVPRMTQDEIREQLALLYRRHTRAESSPDPALRHEAAIMLDVIAGLQEKYLGSALTLPDREGEE